MFIRVYYTQFVQRKLYQHELVTVGLYNRVKWRVIVSYKGLKKSPLYMVVTSHHVKPCILQIVSIKGSTELVGFAFSS
jgi:hypothetical protein